MKIHEYVDYVKALNPLQESKFIYESKRWKQLNSDYVRSIIEYQDKEITREDVINAYRYYYAGMSNWYVPFLLTMIWGFSTNGYGNYRTNNYLSGDGNQELIIASLEAIKNNDLQSAYKSLNKIKGLNVSYISKVLYFATRACDYEHYALIFDIRVARSLIKLSVPHQIYDILEVTPSTKFKHYEQYNALMHAYAKELAVDAESLEMFLFEQKYF